MDKNYWKNVYKSREEIFNLVMDHNVFGLKSFGSISPIYGQIIDNGGIGLEFYLGIPSRLYTPLGFLPIFSGRTWSKNTDSLVERLITDYGIVLISKAERIISTGQLFGPIYAITKLPWISEPLPIFQYQTQEDPVDFAEFKRTYFEKEELCNEIDVLYSPCRKVENKKTRVEDEFYTSFHINNLI